MSPAGAESCQERERSIGGRRCHGKLSSRRNSLRPGTAGGLTAALCVGTSAAAVTGGTADAAPATFTHPGLLHAYGELNRAKVRVAAGDDPWLSGWNRLTANSHSAGTWTPNPKATIIRGGTGENYGILYNDIHAAYQNALRWKIAGTTANGDTAVEILNAWSSTLTTVTGNADRFLAAGIYGYQFANAAELMRGHSGFDLDRFRTMMLDVFHPLNNQFLTGHNDACITNYWANWDLCNMNSILAIGILCDDGAKYDQAVDYFKNGGQRLPHARHPLRLRERGTRPVSGVRTGPGPHHHGHGPAGRLRRDGLVPGRRPVRLRQQPLLEGRPVRRQVQPRPGRSLHDVHLGHGPELRPAVADRDLPASRGQVRPVWDILHYHYARRRGLSVPYITAMAESVRPEGGGGDYGPNSGGFDQLGFGTLMYAK